MKNIKLKNTREQKGLTQAQVARAAGVSCVAYQNYEANRKTPNVKTALAIAEVLESSVEELFSDQRRVGSSERPTR